MVWHNNSRHSLHDSLGHPFVGNVLSISDSGFAVGESDEGGFIWHETFSAVRMFDEWITTTFGKSFASVDAVTRVVLDGDNLSFATGGKSYFVSACVIDRREHAYHNDDNSNDVNGDGTVSPLV